MNKLLESFIKERNYSEHTVKAYRGDLENFRDFLLKEEKRAEDTDVGTINAHTATLAEKTPRHQWRERYPQSDPFLRS